MAKVRSTETETASSAAEAAPLAYVILLDDWRDHKAGKVLAADPDLLSAAEVEGAKHRVATDFERRLGGFVD